MESKRGSDNQGKIKGLINALRKNKEFEKEFREKIISSYGIGDKNMENWDQEIAIRIPNDANPQQCREILVQIDNCTEKVSRYHRRAKVAEATMRAAYEEEFDNAFEQCYKEALSTQKESGAKKLPAKDTLTALADKRAEDTKRALHHAQIATMFFKQVLDKLNSQREDIKSILISLGIEAKALQSGAVND